MFDNAIKPTEKDILYFLEKPASIAWIDLTSFLNINYDFVPETTFYGKKYGWTVRYRRSGKTLCSLFPEKGSFTILLVFGKNEIQKFEELKFEFSQEIVQLYENTKKLHDGKWLWIRVHKSEDLEDVKMLIVIKKKPKKKD
ncbi:hypothetical protein ES705_31822 [subsurface metagenome]